MSDLRDRLVAALAGAYRADRKPNPLWDRRAEHTAHLTGDDYPHPETIPATVDDMADRTPSVFVPDAGDGYPSVRSATIGEIVDVALTALDDQPACGRLRAWLHEEQLWHWAELHDAVRVARVPPPVVPGHWSVQCNNIAWRIAQNARLVGAISWEQVQTDLLLSGVYEKVLRAAGVTWSAIDWDCTRDLYNRAHEGGDGAVWEGPPTDLTDVYPDWTPDA